MKKSYLLPFCFLCVCGVSACSGVSGNSEQVDIIIPEEETPVIDATVNPYNRCGVNGISCNDTALTNYTKTEADYRAYGERTKRDHLYTTSGAGNNLTATIQPGLEDDVVVPKVVVRDTVRAKNTRKYMVDDGVFSETGTLELETQPEEYAFSAPILPKKEEPKAEVQPEPQPETNSQPKAIKNSKGQVIIRKPATKQNEIKRGDNVKTVEIREVKVNSEDGETYEIVCEEECDDILNDDVITSEFTEESFDIADYVEETGDDDVEFTDVGKEKQMVADVSIDEVQIGDDTVLTWEAEEGENLRELLTKWSAMSGWKLLWNTNRNYILSAGVMFKGKFADVSSALIRAFARARPAPIATYYKGNRVIVVETMENENAY